MDNIEYFKQLIGELHSLNNHEQIKEKFKEIASHLMNKLCINAGGRKYRIVECEIYYNDGENHQDSYLYGTKNHNAAEQQKKMLHWYFHDAGIDFTIGNDYKNNKKIKGGILIRSVQEINNNVIVKPLNGPIILRNGILNNIQGDAFTLERYLYLEIFEGNNKNEELVTTKRIGLDNSEIKKEDDYFNKEYRFIDMEYLMKLKGKENIAKHLFNERKITKEKAMKISGRKANFFENDPR